eukprot:c34632_g1_i1 orf=269-511(-)
MVILRQILQHCEEEKAWQRARQGSSSEARSHQPAISDWLNREARRKVANETQEGTTQEASQLSHGHATKHPLPLSVIKVV